MSTQVQKQFNVLLIGDNCSDLYVYGHVERLSPEAPVPVFQPVKKIIKQGMAGNVCNNLEALGCKVDFIHGEISEKERLIDIQSKQHLIRIDRDKVSSAVELASDVPLYYDAIVISDYNKGTVSYDLIKKIRQEFKGPIFVDTKKTDLALLEGCFIKINNAEHALAKTLPSGKFLIVTQGSAGVLWNSTVYPTTPVEIADVTGAGDTFLSALTYKFLQSNSIEQALDFANRAAGVTVQHTGVYSPTLDEIV